MTTTSLNTANQTFRQLFGNGLSYHVPPFQRDYSWGDDEWDDLWQDILALFDEEAEPAHYMGYLVFQSSDSKRFDIIDGQQRLTTFSLIVLAGLSCLKDLIESGNDSDKNVRRMEQLQRSYIGYVDPVTLMPKSKLELNRHSNRFYQTYLVPLEILPQRGLNRSEHQLRKAFHWFKSRISDQFSADPDGGEKFAGMLENLVDRIFFTVICVTDELNAFKVFETLNARGVRLSATDLLKNYLFSLIHSPNSHDHELKLLEDRWERIIGLLGGDSFSEFLQVFWNSRHKLVRKADLFKTIRRRIDSREKAFELLRDLDNSAGTYSALRDPRDTLWNPQERTALEQLLMFNVRQPHAMLMACHQVFFEDDRHAFDRILRAVSVISFRYNVICNMQTHDQERLYNDIAQKVSNGDCSRLSDVFSALRAVYPQDDTFKTVFASKELRTTDNRNKKVVRYILFELERQLHGRAFDAESATYSLEHILPENAVDDWAFIEESKQDRLIYRLGNMTLLETRRNREVGNAGYEIKRNAYQQSDFRITRKIAEHYDLWTEEKIDSRQKQMANVASSIWSVQFDNFDD